MLEQNRMFDTRVARGSVENQKQTRQPGWAGQGPSRQSLQRTAWLCGRSTVTDARCKGPGTGCVQKKMAWPCLTPARGDGASEQETASGFHLHDDK